MSDTLPPGSEPHAARHDSGRHRLRLQSRHDAIPEGTSGDAPATGAEPLHAEQAEHGVPEHAQRPARAQESGPAGETAPPKRSLARRPFIILGILAAAVLLVVGGYLVYMHGKETTDDAQIAADVVPVAARIGGQVRRVPVRDNQEVKKGDLLVEIDPSEAQARVQQAAAELATAQAQVQAAQAQVQIVEASSRGGLTSARAGVSSSTAAVSAAEAQVTAAQAGLARAKATARRARSDWKRSQDLFAEGAIPRATLDRDRAAYDSANAGLQQAEAQLAEALGARRVAQQQVGEAQGKLDQSAAVDARIAAAQADAQLAVARAQAAQAALELAKLQLSYTRIVAPADGVASKLAVHPGQLVQVGQPVIELVPDRTYVVANFKETQIGSMKVGQRALVHVDAYHGRDFEGRVESLSGATGSTFSILPPDNATGNFVKVVQRVPVRIAWVRPPTDVALEPGLSVEVTVYVD